MTEIIFPFDVKAYTRGAALVKSPLPTSIRPADQDRARLKLGPTPLDSAYSLRMGNSFLGLLQIFTVSLIIHTLTSRNEAVKNIRLSPRLPSGNSIHIASMMALKVALGRITFVASSSLGR